MQAYKNNTIKKTQRAIASLLLISQLLTSCGGKAMLLPIDQKTTIQETTCIDDDHSQLDPQTTTLIDGTPLKLGQQEIQFAWDDEKGLQTFIKNSNRGSVTAYAPIKRTPIIKDVNGKTIHFRQFNKEQAEFVAKNFKWGVTKDGELQEHGVRLRGGMGKKGKDTGKGGDSDKGDGKKGKNTGKGGASGSGKGDGEKGKNTGKEIVPDKGDGEKGEETNKGWGPGKGDGKKGKDKDIGKGIVPNKGYGKKGEETNKGWGPGKGNGKKGKDTGRGAKQGKDSQQAETEAWRQYSSKGSWLIKEETGEYLFTYKGTNELLKWDYETQQLKKISKPKRNSECTDCSADDPDQHQNYHVVALGVVKDFFKEHFQTSPYLDPTEVSTITQSIHATLAGDHDKKRALLIGDIKDGKGVLRPKGKIKVEKEKGKETIYTLNGLNVVVAFISFIDKEGKEIEGKKMRIKCGGIEGIQESVFKSFDRYKNSNDHTEKLEPTFRT